MRGMGRGRGRGDRGVILWLGVPKVRGGGSFMSMHPKGRGGSLKVWTSKGRGGSLVLRTVDEFIIYYFTQNPMEHSRRFHDFPWPSMTFHGFLWDKFSDIPELSRTFHNFP